MRPGGWLDDARDSVPCHSMISLSLTVDGL